MIITDEKLHVIESLIECKELIARSSVYGMHEDVQHLYLLEKHLEELLTKTNSAQVWAPPIDFGPWIQLFTHYPMLGSTESFKSTISFKTNSQAPSSYAVEVSAGNKIYKAIGDGSIIVTVSTEFADVVKIRMKSFSIGQNVIVRFSL